MALQLLRHSVRSASFGSLVLIVFPVLSISLSPLKAVQLNSLPHVCVDCIVKLCAPLLNLFFGRHMLDLRHFPNVKQLNPPSVLAKLLGCTTQ
jgi:hypothetical protein